MKLASKLTLGILAMSMAVSAWAVPNIKPGEVLRDNQVYRTSLSSQPPSLDVNISYDGESEAVLRNIYATLVREDFDGNIVPYAAESWDVSPDGKTYTFHLRKDAKWSNGEPVTAKDFVYSWRRLIDPQTASLAQSYLSPLFIVNVDDVVKGDKPPSELGVKAIDDYTFEVELTQPVPWFLAAITYVSTAPAYEPAIKQHGLQWIRPENIVTNGPFMLSELKINELVSLKKNPYFWDADKVVLTDVKFSIVGDGMQNYRAFKAGELDISGVPKTVFAEAEKSGLMISQPRYTVFGYAFNINTYPDVRIRKAITLALDAELIVNKVVKNNQKVAKTWTPPYIIEAQDIKPMQIYNLSQAERNQQAQLLLKEAGYSKANPLELTLTTPSTSNADTKQMYIAIQSVINTNTGGLVKLTLDSMEWKVFLEKQRLGEIGFGHGGWGADFNHISNFLDIWLPESPVNYSKIDDPVFNKFYNQANQEMDAKKRAELYAKAEYQLLNVSYAVIPLLDSVTNTMYAADLRGISNKALRPRIEDRYFIDLKKSTNK